MQPAALSNKGSIRRYCALVHSLENMIQVTVTRHRVCGP